MPDIVRVTTSQSWFSRIARAIVGVGLGLLLVVGSFPLLWWNEGRAVHRARSLAEGASIVVDVPADQVSPANDGKLVHVTGVATTEQTVRDPDFGIAEKAIRLARNAETYQWREESKSQKRKKLGGSEETTTTYTYSKIWSSRHLDSSSFHSPAGHENPPSLAWESRTFTADRVTCGGFTLPSDIVAKIGHAELRPVEDPDEQAVRAPAFRVEQNFFYKGANPSDPQIGDIRVQFEVTRPQTISLVAQQRGSSFAAYQARAGSDILLVEEGQVSAAQMFKAAQTANTITTWLVRVGGFLALFIGVVLILKPLSVFGSAIPFIGRLVGAGAALIAFLVALVLSLTTIAFAWLAYRPLIGGSLLALAAGAVILILRSRRSRAVVPPPIPPPIPTEQT